MAGNFTSKIFNNAISALSAQQAIIATTSNNISNVNTEGYTRRVMQLQTRVSSSRGGGLNIGNGVEASSLTRVNDKFLEGILRDSFAEKNRTQVEDEYLGRLEELFSLEEGALTIGSALTDFYAAIDNLSLDPASIELRSDLIERATDLVNTIKTTYNEIANLQREADNRLTDEVNVVNNLVEQIADLNGKIVSRESTGSVAADERDKRDLLLQQLSEKLSYKMVETSDGSVTISLDNGFPLVSGTNYRKIELTNSPSFNSGTLPPSLDGGTLRYIVYDYDTGSGSAHIDLTQILKKGEGSIAGLLRLRGYSDTSDTSAFDADGPLVEIASRIEAISRELLTTFNTTYLGPDRDAGTSGHQPSSGDLDGNTPSVYGFFDFNYSGVKDIDGDGLPDDVGNISAIDNFSSILQLTSTDPRKIAAARDVSGGPPNPASFPQGDNQNLVALSALQNQQLSFSAGSYSLTGTFDDVYSETVGRVGNLKLRAEMDAKIADSKLVTAQNRRDSISAVSLDEEFVKLTQFQKVFEANARIISTATDLLDQVISII